MPHVLRQLGAQGTHDRSAGNVAAIHLKTLFDTRSTTFVSGSTPDLPAQQKVSPSARKDMSVIWVVVGPGTV
jgi:hypothetical protein